MSFLLVKLEIDQVVLVKQSYNCLISNCNDLGIIKTLFYQRNILQLKIQQYYSNIILLNPKWNNSLKDNFECLLKIILPVNDNTDIICSIIN